jgi:hypothetical protein
MIKNKGYMSYLQNEDLLEKLFEQYLAEGYTEEQAADLAHQEFEMMSL